MALSFSSLDDYYSLSPEQTEAFQRDGHIKISALASPEEIAVAKPAILQAFSEMRAKSLPLAKRDTYGKAFIQVMNLWLTDDQVKRFVLSRRFAQVAAELMRVDGVRIYHDQALFKEPGGGGTPWHQDQHYWPLDTDKTVTMWMPLVDANSSMGTMHFASGSQTEGYLGDLPISDESERRLSEFLGEKGYPIVSAGAMSAGDATFHTGWTLHGAPGNQSSLVREVMTIIYFADGTRIGPTDNQYRKNDLNSWLPGLATGDLAASKLNPLVYSKSS